MRRLKLQVQLSVDGFIAGPNGEMDWMEWNWDDQLKQFIGEITKLVDCIVLGRKLAEGFIPHWAGVAANKNDPEQSAGQKFTETHKVVFTKNLEKADWPNTVLEKGELATAINQLKEQNGKDIMAYGGGTFVSALIQNNLVDDYFLLVNPTAIGNGMPIFRELAGNLNLSLIKTLPFACGIVLLHYQPKRKN